MFKSLTSLRFFFLSFLLLLCPFLSSSCFAASDPPSPPNPGDPTSILKDVSEFLDGGAAGFLLWQYSGDKSSPLDNDPYSFYRNDPVCPALQELSQHYPGKFLGVNMHSLAKYSDGVIDSQLAYLSENCGTTVVRIWASPDRGTADRFRAVLDIAARHNIRLILVLADYSNGTTTILPSSIHSDPTSWYQSGYSTGGYLNHVTSIINAVGNHPALYAIELANEPHCNGISGCPPFYNQWVNSVAGTINSLNSSVKVGIGQMASQNTTLGDSPDHGSPSDFTQSNSSGSISVTSGHFYNPTEKANVLTALSQSKSLGKTFYVGEASVKNSSLESCDLENTINYPGVVISEDYSHDAPIVPAASLQYQFKDNVPNNINDSATVACKTSVNISETKTPPLDPLNIGKWLFLTVERIVGTVLMIGPVTNDANRLAGIFWANKLQSGLNSTPEEINQKFTSFGPDAWNAAIRSTSYEDQLKLKDDRLARAVNNRSGISTTTIDEQVAWGCGDHCFSVNCKKPSATCRPVYLSEVAHFRGVASSPKVIESFNVPNFQQLSFQCYQNIYNLMEITDSGSYETNKAVINLEDNKTSESVQAYPWAASILNEQGRKLISAQEQQKINPNEVCNATSGQATTDEPSPLTLKDLFKFIGIVIDNPKAFTAALTGNFLFDEKYVKGIIIEEKAKQLLIPAKSQISLASSSLGQNNRIDPGAKAAKYNLMQGAFFLPANWQTANAGRDGRGQDIRTPYTLPYVGSGSVTPEFCTFIFRYAPQVGLDPYLIAGLISVESSFNPNAISSAGAVGLMQVMPRDGLAAELYPGVFDDRPTVAELLQPEFNVSYGTSLLANLSRYYGSLRDGLFHYGPIGIGYSYPDYYVLPAAEKFRTDPTFCQTSITPTP